MAISKTMLIGLENSHRSRPIRIGAGFQFQLQTLLVDSPGSESKMGSYNPLGTCSFHSFIRLGQRLLALLGLLLLVGYGLATPIFAQNRVGQVDNIEKPPTGANAYGPRELVRSVEVFRRNGPTDIGYKEMSLNFGDEINVKRGDPQVYRIIIGYDDPTLKLLKLAPGDYVRLVDRDTVQSEGGFLGWFQGKLRATTKYIQAIAPGTQYGVEVDGERTRVFVWEGEVRVTNIGPSPLTISVGEKRLTEAFGPSQPSSPRVPSFNEIKNMVLFGLDLDPVIRGTVTDENLRLQLHEDLTRAEFESRVQRTAVSPQINLANVYLFLGKNEEALKAFDEAERISPRPSAIYNGRGVALAQLGRYDASNEAFKQALSRDNESIFHNNLGNLYLLRGDSGIEQALVEYEQASERDADNAAPLNGRGVALLRRKDFSSAQVAFEKSVQLKDRALGRSNLGNAYLLQDNLPAAEAEYAKALQLEPQAAAALNNRGVSHLRQRQYQQAREDFDQSIQVNPQDPAPRIGLGLAYVGLSQFEAAVSAFLDALKPGYSNRTAYRNLAYLFKTREPARAIILDRLQQAGTTAEVSARAPLDQFIQFLQTLPSVPEKEFDDAFQKFQIAAR